MNEIGGYTLDARRDALYKSTTIGLLYYTLLYYTTLLHYF